MLEIVRKQAEKVRLEKELLGINKVNEREEEAKQRLMEVSEEESEGHRRVYEEYKHIID